MIFKQDVFDAVLTDFSKAFDCIHHKHLTAKVNAYGFEDLSLLFIYAYLKFMKQKTKVCSVFSNYLKILFLVFSKDLYLYHFFQCLHLRYVFPN